MGPPPSRFVSSELQGQILAIKTSARVSFVRDLSEQAQRDLGVHVDLWRRSTRRSRCHKSGEPPSGLVSQ